MRTNDVAKLFLRWIVDEHHGDAMSTARFLDAGPTVDGEPVAEVHLGRVLDRLEDLGLAWTLKTLGSTLPVDVRLTPRGWQCVEEHDGDVSAFEVALRGGTSTTTQTMNVHQRDGGNVSGFTGGDVAQSSRVEVGAPERIRAGADAVEELLRLYPGTQNRTEIESAVEDARKAASDGDDEARATASGRLVAAITTMSGVSTLARFVIDWLGGPNALG